MNPPRHGVDQDVIPRRLSAKWLSLMNDDLLVLSCKFAIDIGLGAEALVILDDERQALLAGA
ncbi:hypothetical protein HB770_30860 (plasmid) [Rhizobium leguminosarum bv. viciae]|uniref:Uncharacterized protein n=1 Tax=Rhizobium leguminosarum bv. viciae TaxID=387 RepID=A0A7G6RNB6_RHILV|nr:hypothetical protein HB770_30860 [Rhizobium leguminosarum bv. viciae]